MKMEQTECSETSAYKIQTPENYPEEIIQNSQLTIKIPRMLCGQRVICLRTKFYLLDETVNELSVQTNNRYKCPRGYHVVLRSTKVAY
jgi:hypothetical protein